MKWLKTWLAQQPNGNFTFKENLTFDTALVKSTNYLLSLKDVIIDGKGFYLKQEETLTLNFEVIGTMIVPCALSLEPTDYKFATNAEIKYSFKHLLKDDEIIVVKGQEVDIIPFVWELISLEIPFKVVKEGATIQTRGEGWELKSEDAESSKTNLDPRLAKLNDYFKKQ